MPQTFFAADAVHLPLADKSIDLVFGSPPYCDARTYGIGAQRKCQEWIDWMLDVTTEAVRVSKGLVIWIVAGVTRKWLYYPGPEGLLYEWWKRGGRCWRPAYWFRHGICGGGQKQGLCPKIEYALFFTGCEKAIPWADNTANGHLPKLAPGGEMSYRLTEGQRRNQWGGTGPVESRGANESDPGALKNKKRPGHKFGTSRRQNGEMKKARRCTRGSKGGDTIQKDAYLPPVLANPGNLIQGIKVGGFVMGNKLCHKNEAPFPEKLAEWFIRSWCKPGGIVYDPFSGSGTTVAAAVTLGRVGIGSDIRLNQCQLARRRCKEIQPVFGE